ncbi:MAG: UvrD-helicase domain-containing protein [Butyrivibrio sp.]|nr:UvrD-helicase domain-containing protein [Butyrivibrio sp.]
MRETIILAPGLNGNELMEMMARRGVSSIDMRICGAGELARISLMRSGISINENILGPDEEMVAVAKAIKDIDYFGSASFTDIGEIRKVINIMRSLVCDGDEEKGISDTLIGGLFAEKNTALIAAYKNYKSVLSDMKAIDLTGVIKKAIENCSPIDADFLTFEEIPLGAVEKKLLDKLSGGNYRRIPISDLFGAGRAAYEKSIYHNCYGASNEVQNIIADIYRGKSPDRCTVAVTDTDTYSQLFFDIALTAGIPMTFGCGIPIINSNPAKLLSYYHRWRAKGFYGTGALMDLLKSDCFDKSGLYETFPKDDENFKTGMSDVSVSTEDAKEKIIPMPTKGYSPTALDTFFSCPRRFMLRYIVGISEPEDDDPFEVISAAGVGVLAHALMEDLSDSDMTEDEFLGLAGTRFDSYILENPPLIEAKADAEKSRFAEMMQTAYRMDPKRRVVLSEEDIECIHESGVKIHGFPDRVEKLDDGTHLIVDFKTGRRVKHASDDIDTCLQVLIYAYLMEKKGYKISGCEYRYLRKDLSGRGRRMMTNVQNDSDALSRNRIVSDIDRNFFVEAGAGSGKTTMLVNRMVAMVEGGIDISRICAITFTKAAANEFYERFQKALIQRSRSEYVWKDRGFAGQLKAPTDESRKRCRDALERIDLCFMGTIDSFCNMALSEHPFDAGIPSDSRIISEDEEDVFYRRMFVRICSGEFGAENKKLSDTFRMFFFDAEAAFVKGMKLVMNNRNVHLNFSENMGADISRIFQADKKEVTDALKTLIYHPEIKYDGEKKSREAWDRIGETYKTLSGNWSYNFGSIVYVLKSMSDIRLLPDSLEKYGVSLGELFVLGGKSHKWLECRVGAEKGLYEKVTGFRYDCSMTFFMRCVPLIEEEMRRKGLLSYFDYLYYLRNMLRKDSENEGKLIEYIYKRHSYFLIDEFQDTNPMQAEVFFYLTAKKLHKDWKKCVPHPGSLFIVGDPKQSIYRFRSADVTSFFRVKKLFTGEVGEVLSLIRNFRSTRKMCSYFNSVFKELLPSETEVQSKYEEIPLPDETQGEFQGVYRYESYIGKSAQVKPEMSDPKKIADIIELLVGRDDIKLSLPGDDAKRPVKYSDIMVITSAKSLLGPIIRELDTRKIPSRVEGSVPFSENEALVEICNVYAAAADPGDEIALYGALKGKLIGTPENEIISVRCSNEIIRELHEKSRFLSPAALFEEILERFKVYTKVEAKNPEIVFYTLELLRSGEKSGTIITHRQGSDYLKGLVSGKSDEERCLSLTLDQNCVHLSNLHKVKGLEAPIVILATASSRSGSRGAAIRIEHTDDGAEGYVFRLERDKNGSAPTASFFETMSFDDKAEEEKLSLKAENARLIYVAATRARNALIISDCGYLRDNAGVVSDSRWKPLLKGNIPDIFSSVSAKGLAEKKQSPSVDAGELYRQAEEECVLNDRSLERATYKTATPSSLKLLSKLSDDTTDINHELTDAPGKGDIPKGQLSAVIGTMTHKLMEMMVSSKGNFSARGAVDEIIKEFSTPESAPYEALLSEKLYKVAETMRNGGYEQKGALPADILSVLLSADEVYCEVPFCFREDTEESIVWNGVMDVIYLQDGAWHIVDYKTNADGNDLDQKYQAQMSAYIRAFKQITGNDADALTYHIDVDARIRNTNFVGGR